MSARRRCTWPRPNGKDGKFDPNTKQMRQSGGEYGDAETGEDGKTEMEKAAVSFTHVGHTADATMRISITSGSSGFFHYLMSARNLRRTKPVDTTSLVVIC